LWLRPYPAAGAPDPTGGAHRAPIQTCRRSYFYGDGEEGKRKGREGRHREKGKGEERKESGWGRPSRFVDLLPRKKS